MVTLAVAKHLTTRPLISAVVVWLQLALYDGLVVVERLLTTTRHIFVVRELCTRKKITQVAAIVNRTTTERKFAAGNKLDRLFAIL